MSYFEKSINNKEQKIVDNIFKDIYINSSTNSFIEQKHITEDICSICLEKLDFTGKRKFACGHYFHKDCIDQWFKTSQSFKCPYCKQCIIKKN